ncbi:MAG: hypothetical protein WD995_10125 [Gemmatimonadota bacterium]
MASGADRRPPASARVGCPRGELDGGALPELPGRGPVAGRGLLAGREAGAGQGAAGAVRGRAPDLRPLATVMALEAGDPLLDVLAGPSIPAEERAALAFAGPAFQWR